MSKIEEMAKSYSSDESSADARMMIEVSFEDGANAVLKEIEKVLVAAYEQYTSKQAVALNTEIYNKIKELKED